MLPQGGPTILKMAVKLLKNAHSLAEELARYLEVIYLLEICP